MNANQDNNINNFKTLLTRKEAADILDCSAGTLAIWSSTQRYNLPYVKIGRKVRYRISDIQNFINSNVR